MVLDILVIIGSFLLACFVISSKTGYQYLPGSLWLLLFIIPIWFIFLVRNKLYLSLRTRTWSQVVGSLIKVQLMGGVSAAACIYLVDPGGVSRAVYGSFLGISLLALILEKTTIKTLLGLIRIRGFNTRKVLVVGTNDSARQVIDLVKQHSNWGIRLVGVLRLDEKYTGSVFQGCTIRGCLDDLVDVCRSLAIDEVVFCTGRGRNVEVDEHIRSMEEMGITSRVVLDLRDSPATAVDISFLNRQLPMLTYYCAPHDLGRLFVKRVFDVLGACVGLLVFVVLFPFIALAIKLDSKGPIFFSQKRVGMNGRIFKCWKLRSMYTDAEKRKKDLIHLNEMNGALFKIKDDPRITRIGAVLRKTSLDELPQFWNVLKGEMSLVGTRPPTPDEVANYMNWHRKRICIKPGITGLWQISGRNIVRDFDEVVKLDLQYIEGWSLALDFRILVKTIWVVFAKNGAY